MQNSHTRIKNKNFLVKIQFMHKREDKIDKTNLKLNFPQFNALTLI